MTDEALRRAYQSASSGPAKGRGECPTPEAINAVVMREGDEATRLGVLDHVMRCNDCRHEFELLRAVHAAGRTRPAWRYQPLAIAASIALLVGLGGTALWTRLRTPGDDTLRGSASQFELLRPAAGAVVTPPLFLVWQPVAGARSYTAELLTPNGRLIRSWTTADTSLAVRTSGDSSVASGSYAWWVRAHLPDGSERQSPVLRFELRKNPAP
jgi:hypothetical protein